MCSEKEAVMGDGIKTAEQGEVPVKGYLNEDFRLFHNTDTLGTDVGYIYIPSIRLLCEIRSRQLYR